MSFTANPASDQDRFVVRAQAPALVVPKVLDPDHCRRLIAYWEAGGKLDDMVSSRDQAGGRAVPQSKIRSDVLIPSTAPESRELREVVVQRLLPEVQNAFNFAVTRMEHFRVGCYEAARSGHFAPHRDNTTPKTAHRRYALTLNLNDGYEGGYLRLPEYGPQLYAPPAGGAVVFPCALLHLATPVVKGRRFVLVQFFWGEAEQPLFERNHPDQQSASHSN